MAIFAYIDETGTSALDDADQSVLTIVAVLVWENQVQPLAESLRALAMRVLGRYPADFEFHGNEVFHGIGHWSALDPPQLIEAYAQALGLLAPHHISIAHSSINKPNLQAQYERPASPYLLGLQFLCERLNSVRPDVPKVLVADESKEHELQAIDMVADLQIWGTGIVPGPRLTSIIDSLHFVRSQASPGVQMADLVGFIIQRHRRATEPHPDAVQALDDLWTMVRDATITYRAEWPVAPPHPPIWAHMR